MRSVVIGDLSGIQDFLFTIETATGSHAKRLRARSLFVQLLAEGAALKILEALHWPRDRLIFSGAGKFVASAEVVVDLEALRLAARQINRWLLEHLHGQLSFAAAHAQGTQTESFLWVCASQALQREKLRAFGDATSEAGSWETSRLVLPRVSIEATKKTFDDETIGGRLPRQNWVQFSRLPVDSGMNILGYGCTLHEVRPTLGPDTIVLFSLDPLAASDMPINVESRCLARHIPVNQRGEPISFTALAGRAKGDQLLAALKMDVDSLGAAFEQRQSGSSLAARELSNRLDRFFAHQLDQDRRTRWRDIYTVFSGGDDLLVIGPWSLCVEYAARVQSQFAQDFSGDGLTISAGLALFRPKYSVQRAIEQSAQLLRQAKALRGDKFAAFGQVWAWSYSSLIHELAVWLTDEVDRGSIQRGWLQEVLATAEAVAGTQRPPAMNASTRELSPLLGTAQLAYQNARKYRNNDFKWWIAFLISDFEEKTQPETQFLPAVLRCALIATRADNVSAS